MTDLEMLKKKIEESGMTMIAISKKTGIVREILYNRLKGKGEFNASEIAVLTKVLCMSKMERDAIFLAKRLNIMQLLCEEGGERDGRRETFTRKRTAKPGIG